ncbi:MAG: ATP:cob(I)alamin adenosyltransferase, partial [Alphaproteobacteria bacterium]|nr:ATP:cob(I)alamin adenosyltransferase [Alphaproteobacteria bacterium]
ARTIMRRAERMLSAATAQNDEVFSEPARAYINRASDLLFVAARCANAGENGEGDILWQPAATRASE